MKGEIEKLKTLQVLDEEIYQRQLEQDIIPTQISEITERVERQKAVHAQAEEEVKNIKLSLSKKELELKEKEETISKYDAQLMQVKTNKEYSALQHEIATIKSDNSLLEEDIITFLDEVQKAETVATQEQSVLSELEKEFDRVKKELEEKVKENAIRIDELKAKKITLSQNVDGEVLAIYEKIVKARTGIALSEIKNESCGACQMRLRPQITNEVLLGKKIVQCESCSRILYIENHDLASN